MSTSITPLTPFVTRTRVRTHQGSQRHACTSTAPPNMYSWTLHNVIRRTVPAKDLQVNGKLYISLTLRRQVPSDIPSTMHGCTGQGKDCSQPRQSFVQGFRINSLPKLWLFHGLATLLVSRLLIESIGLTSCICSNPKNCPGLIDYPSQTAVCATTVGGALICHDHVWLPHKRTTGLFW